MQKALFILCVALAYTYPLWGQPVGPTPACESPSAFLGYPLGSKFTFHHRIVDYVEHVAATSPRVRLIPYGTSFEGRPLMVAAISSPDNLNKLEDIRQKNLIRANLLKGKKPSTNVPVVWLSYNIHGDEAACSEAAMTTLFHLATGKKDTSQWIDKLVVLIDPCVNPDGHERYVNWFTHVAGAPIDLDPHSMEHHHPWPGGRTNHYLIDLNRDWCWQTQHESRARTALYRKWMPQILVDFHEMNVESPYFFAPAARPYHEEITPWQREFQHTVGSNNARYFDKNHWLYYTNEVYDLFYPSYGDTWSMFNGAVGFTYEQGGSRRAGVAIERRNGDTLTLNDRVLHHVTSGLSTVEVAALNHKELLEAYEAYFNGPLENGTGRYKSYVIKHTNEPERVKALLTLLDNQQITYSRVDKDINPKKLKGFDYHKNTEANVTLEPLDIVISSFQPQGRLLKVLFEPDSYLEDSLTYDLTAWALPYVFGVKSFATEERLSVKTDQVEETYVPNQIEGRPYAYLTEWVDVQDAQFLSALIRAGIRVRFAKKSFVISGKQFLPGSLIITRADNSFWFDSTLIRIADANRQTLTPLVTGKVESGTDLGSENATPIRPPKVALLGGDGVSENSFGEVWHYFEQEIKYPLTRLHNSYFEAVDLSEFQVLILPSGNHAAFKDKILEFAEKGGKVIILENAITSFTKVEENKVNSQLALELEKIKEKKKEVQAPTLTQNPARRYHDRERTALSDEVAGSIYRISLDNSHPLAFGYSSDMFLIKRNSKTYPYLNEQSWNVGRFTKESHVSGFVGSRLKKKVPNTLAIGVESLGRGRIIYMTDSPVFRTFWHNGKLLMSNAVFFRF